MLKEREREVWRRRFAHKKNRASPALLGSKKAGDGTPWMVHGLRRRETNSQGGRRRRERIKAASQRARSRGISSKGGNHAEYCFPQTFLRDAMHAPRTRFPARGKEQGVRERRVREWGGGKGRGWRLLQKDALAYIRGRTWEGEASGWTGIGFPASSFS